MTKVKNPKISINRSLCKGCGICIDFCPTSVYERDAEGKPVIKDIGLCTACRQCEFRCPDFAIRIGGREIE